MTEPYDWNAHDKWEHTTRSQEISRKDAERRRAHGELTDAMNREKEHKLETIIAGVTTCIPIYFTLANIPYAQENIANAAASAMGAIATAVLARYFTIFYRRYSQSHQETLSARDYLGRVNSEFTRILRNNHQSNDKPK